MAGFEGAEHRWVEKLGRLRDAVRQRLVGEQLRELVADRAGLRVLDVGCGQGTQALALARAGHAVVGLDPSQPLLDRFAATLAAEPAGVRRRVTLVAGGGEEAPERAPGPFDLLLCHGVLMYLDDAAVARTLAGMTAVAAPGAALSLLVRNGLAPAMRPGLLGEWGAAVAAMSGPGSGREYVNRLGVTARMHTPDDLAAVLGPLGWRVERWYGVRVFTDHLEEPARPGDEMEALLDAERRAARTDPYRQVSALLHLVYALTPDRGPGARSR